MKQQEEQARPDHGRPGPSLLAGQSGPHGGDLDAILPLVRKPGRYIGREQNAVSKDWGSALVRFCLVFPDLYEIGMSHQGLQILYHLLNRDDRFLAHRCYAPDVDMEQALRRAGLPLFALESRRPLADYDVLGITLPYELCYTNILTVLDLAGLPLRAAERGPDHPLVIGGGSCAMNPEPVADFFDLILLGDGEEAIIEIGTALVEAGAGEPDSVSRAELLATLAAIEGVYVPSLYRPQYRDGRFWGVESLRPGQDRVRRRVLPALNLETAIRRPLVPVVKTIHDRLGIELARGCTRGCRFCQAGMIYRPVRERDPGDVFRLAEEGIGSSGFDELALLSLSTGDYSCLEPVIGRLMNRFAGEHVSLSMPSMRVGTLTPEIIDQIRRVRKTGFTVAPEAGSERLRQVINKGITEQDLLATCRDAAAAGWNQIKFYFMIGLPTETDEDVEAIGELVARARAAAGGGRMRITVSVATFVPKPHTPFQWHRQLDRDQARDRFTLLKRALPRKGVRLKYHDPATSLLEGVFARGDRQLSHFIETAWKNGCRLDGWSEHFDLQMWREAGRACGFELESWLGAREVEAPLPWDHLDCGVERDFLVREWDRALRREYTPDCRNRGCQQCGLCDFKTIRPRTAAAPPETIRSGPEAKTASPQRVFRYRFHYQRLGDARFFSHLETLQLIFRALRRAGLPVRFSQGYNPSPRVSFGQALSVGMESRDEVFWVELSEPLADPGRAVRRINRFLPPGMEILDCSLAGKKEQRDQLVSYRITLPAGNWAGADQRLADFLAAESHVIERVRKGRSRQLDIRPLVAGARLADGVLELDLVQRQGAPAIGPLEFLERVCGIERNQALLARILKTGARERQPG